MEYGAKVNVTQWDEYTIEEIIIIDDFRADSMQFNELLILLDPLSQRNSTS